MCQVKCQKECIWWDKYSCKGDDGDDEDEVEGEKFLFFHRQWRLVLCGVCNMIK